MALEGLSRYLVLPELLLLNVRRARHGGSELFAEKVSPMEVCPRCATPSKSVYDRRWVRLRDEPLRGGEVTLWVKKRRFACATCQRPFTEPIDGVRKGYRTTQRYRRRLLWACEHFSDLKAVRRTYRCSSALLHRVLYEQLELERRKRLYAWPEKVGIDEHLFKHDFRLNQRRFVTMVVDHKNKRLMEVVEGKDGATLRAALDHIPGRENVRFVALDLSDGYRSFARDFFPNAQLVADKFHVLRLITPAIHRRIKELGLGREALPFYRLLRKNPLKLPSAQRWQVQTWLADKPVLRELWTLKAAINRVYRILGHGRAKRALVALLNQMAGSSLPEVLTLRTTLYRWRREVLAYFLCRLTNARTEGFNGKAKLVIRRAYGYKSFRNYRLRLLSSCA
ncbi:MAG TPA: ISL3 family transposase [Polyangiaceae bacterium]|nr:ISL3 family transposase [Polyangiaceae bacterium]